MRHAINDGYMKLRCVSLFSAPKRVRSQGLEEDVRRQGNIDRLLSEALNYQSNIDIFTSDTSNSQGNICTLRIEMSNNIGHIVMLHFESAVFVWWSLCCVQKR